MSSLDEKIPLEVDEKTTAGAVDDHVDGSWLDRRAAVVRQALEDEDYDTLQRVAALPGGFGTDELRKEVWPALLHTKHFFPDSSGSNGDKPTASEPEGDQEDTKEEAIMKDALDDELSREAGPSSNPAPTEPELKEHHDEEQVSRDTNRSFVTYPKGLHLATKKTMQDDLQSLIVHVLRLYPTLSYFQGYHDIMSVLYLTFVPLPPPPASRSRSSTTRSRNRPTGHVSPFKGDMTPVSGSTTPLVKEASNVKQEAAAESGETCASTTALEEKLKKEVGTEDADRVDRGRQAETVTEDRRSTDERRLLCQCAEVVSLCRVRDAMGKGMEPMMGLLKLLQRLLKAADPELSKFSSTISPVPTLPFFALSWILCLFSHDIDSLEPIQRMFDYLLSRNPISAIYLAVAILVAKKKQMFRLAKELGSEAADDPSLLHPLFSRLPPLYPDTPDHPGPPPSVKVETNREDEENPYDPIPLSKIFGIADDLLARYPWDGPVIRGREVLGPASVALTFDREFHLGSVDVAEEAWTLRHAEKMAEGEMVLPGACEPDEEEEEEPAPVKKPIRRRKPKRDRRGTVLAIGVVVVGIGIAMYGVRAGGVKADWAGWWAIVLRSWVDKRGWGEYGQNLRTVGGFVRKTLREIV